MLHFNVFSSSVVEVCIENIIEPHSRLSFAPLATIVAEVYHCHFLLTIKNLKGTYATFSTYMLVDNLDKSFDI